MLSKQPVFGSQGVVACTQRLATQEGVLRLTPGDNALHAAITSYTIVNSSQSYIFAYATRPYCDGLAPSW
jgi:gamma-glutamyltranspeptidase